MAGIFGRTKQTLRRVQMLGNRDVRQRLRRIRKKANLIIADHLFLEGLDILRMAKKIVPFDTGNLSSTGTVTPPKARGGRVFVEVKFGGRRAPYAIIQHENLEYHHDPPRQAKYLEQPARAHMKGMDERVGIALNKGMRVGKDPLTGRTGFKAI